jgi:hypothetical protein
VDSLSKERIEQLESGAGWARERFVEQAMLASCSIDRKNTRRLCEVNVELLGSKKHNFENLFVVSLFLSRLLARFSNASPLAHTR